MYEAYKEEFDTERVLNLVFTGYTSKSLRYYLSPLLSLQIVLNLVFTGYTSKYQGIELLINPSTKKF